MAMMELFQYRKRYEITCDAVGAPLETYVVLFQYRKRYEITCDLTYSDLSNRYITVSIPQAV